MTDWHCFLVVSINDIFTSYLSVIFFSNMHILKEHVIEITNEIMDVHVTDLFSVKYFQQ